MAMTGKIRRMYFREKKSVREISRLTSLSRNTIDKWLKALVEREPAYCRKPGPIKLTPYVDQLTGWLRADARRPKRERRTAKALFAALREAGYEGGYSRVTDFVWAWRQNEGAGCTHQAFVPLSFAFGEAFQFDWSEKGLVVGGIYYRV